MKASLQITIRDPSASKAIEGAVHEKAAKLNEFCDQITSCHVIKARLPGLVPVTAAPEQTSVVLEKVAIG